MRALPNVLLQSEFYTVSWKYLYILTFHMYVLLIMYYSVIPILAISPQSEHELVRTVANNTTDWE